MSILQMSWKPLLVTFIGFSLLFLSSCSETAVPPTAEQATQLTKRISACKTLEAKQSRLTHLAEHRNRLGIYFSCEDLERECNANYLGDHCESTKIIVAVETAFEKTCRRNRSASGSSACKRLGDACNVKGFQSEECASAIAPYLY